MELDFKNCWDCPRALSAYGLFLLGAWGLASLGGYLRAARQRSLRLLGLVGVAFTVLASSLGSMMVKWSGIAWTGVPVSSWLVLDRIFVTVWWGGGIALFIASNRWSKKREATGAA